MTAATRLQGEFDGAFGTETIERGRVLWTRRWIAVTAGAWLLGLAVFLMVATPLWWPGQALALTVFVGVPAGALMATTVAVVTGLALRSFVSSASDDVPQ